MSKYRIESVGSCVESKKDLKKRLKVEKLKLKDFIEILEEVDMDYSHRSQVVGGMYLDIVNMEKRLKEM